jgi:hypothetical protein
MFYTAAMLRLTTFLKVAYRPASTRFKRTEQDTYDPIHDDHHERTKKWSIDMCEFNKTSRPNYVTQTQFESHVYVNS